MSLLGTIYNTLFQRTSTSALTIAVGGFFAERLIDEGAKYVYKSANKGRLWDDIKHKYDK